MIPPKFPENESERLNAVKEYDLLDTLPESDFDNITNLVGNICNVPVSLITLLDTERNFLKSHRGLDFNESPRIISFCGHAILSNEPIFIIEDATKDERFYDNPLTLNGATFYAGVPLVNPQGYPLGTLCVYDIKPRQLTTEQKESLIILAKQVVNLFELRLKNNTLNKTLEALNERHKTLKMFAHKVSHDIKSPLTNITSLSQVFKDEIKSSYPEINLDYLNYIEDSADTLKAYVDGMLEHYKNESLVDKNKKEVKLIDIYSSIKNILALNDNEFKLLNNPKIGNVNAFAIKQILLNLVDNAFKYNPKESPLVVIDYSEDNTHHYFYVKDNGMGIEKEKQEALFDLFHTNHETDKFGKKGTGIGLFTVKSLVKKLGGTIEIDSMVNKGATFKFSILK